MTTIKLLNSNDIRLALTQQLECYPKSTLRDVYKNFFQDAFGPGHLLGSTEQARERLLTNLTEELAQVQEQNTSLYYEKTGATGIFYRVNLHVITENLIGLDDFFEAFLESAKTFTLPL